MMDWIEKIPDSMTGALVAGVAWFGFNYAVLAPRAIERAHATQSMPSCMEALDRHQRRLQLPQLDLSRRLGLPEFESLERIITELALPRMLSPAEQSERCACAAARAGRSLRFDYAIHTTSFRLVEPEAVAGLGDRTIGTALEGVCGAIPQLRRGR